MVGSLLHVSVALVLSARVAAPPVDASPTAAPQVTETTGEDAVDEEEVAGETTETVVGETTETVAGETTETVAGETTADTTTTVAIDPEMQAPAEDEVHQPYAVPPPRTRPRWNRGDKRLREARGMLAAGIVFATVCGAGAGLGVWVLVDRRTRPSGQDNADAVAAVTGLLSCTVGALALASAGALRLRRGR